MRQEGGFYEQGRERERGKDRESSADLARERSQQRDMRNELSVLRNGELTKYDGEFDPGSERTLAARIKHASRTGVRGFGPA